MANKKRRDLDIYNRDMVIRRNRRSMELRELEQAQMQYEYTYQNTNQLYTTMPVQYTSGSITTMPMVIGTNGSQMIVGVDPVMPTAQPALPAAKEDPLAWLDRRVNEICKVGALA